MSGVEVSRFLIFAINHDQPVFSEGIAHFPLILYFPLKTGKTGNEINLPHNITFFEKMVIYNKNSYSYLFITCEPSKRGPIKKTLLRIIFFPKLQLISSNIIILLYKYTKINPVWNSSKIGKFLVAKLKLLLIKLVCHTINSKSLKFYWNRS